MKRWIGGVVLSGLTAFCFAQRLLEYRAWPDEPNKESTGLKELENSQAGSPGEIDLPWQSLFNGKDLRGWRHLGGGEVSVSNGLLRLENDRRRRGGYVIHGLKARDFRARICCKIIRGDSGFCFHCGPHPRTAVEILGVQLQLNIERELGGLFEMHGRGWLSRPARPVTPVSASDWLECEVAVAGSHIQTWINGEPVVQYRCEAPGDGHFAFQIHGGGYCDMLVRDVSVQVRR